MLRDKTPDERENLVKLAKPKTSIVIIIIIIIIIIFIISIIIMNDI